MTTMNNIPTPYESCGFVRFGELWLTPDQARKKADEFDAAANHAEESMAQLRSGLLHKLN